MRKKIKQGQKVEVSFSPRERVLVLEHTFTAPALEQPAGSHPLAAAGHRERSATMRSRSGVVNRELR